MVPLVALVTGTVVGMKRRVARLGRARGVVIRPRHALWSGRLGRDAPFRQTLQGCRTRSRQAVASERVLLVVVQRWQRCRVAVVRVIRWRQRAEWGSLSLSRGASVHGSANTAFGK